MTVCLTHLNPHDVERRLGEVTLTLTLTLTLTRTLTLTLNPNPNPNLGEARAIVQRVPRDRPFLLAGDLNTLSGLDRAAPNPIPNPNLLTLTLTS